MPLDLPAHVALHQMSHCHRVEVEGSDRCGCFHCCRFFDAPAVAIWVDAGATALCPFCGVDAVLPEKGLDRPLSQEMLEGMHQVYFAPPGESPAEAFGLGALPAPPPGPGGWAQAMALEAALSPSRLQTDAQLRARLRSAFPWAPTLGVGVGWMALGAPALLLPTMGAWALGAWAVAMAWSGGLVAGALLGVATARQARRWASWARAWRALRAKRWAAADLGRWLDGQPGRDYTPQGPADFYWREAADWARALPMLGWMFQEWERAGRPLRRCDLSRFIQVARDRAGQAGPYRPGEPL